MMDVWGTGIQLAGWRTPSLSTKMACRGIPNGVIYLYFVHFVHVFIFNRNDCTLRQYGCAVDKLDSQKLIDQVR